jgi:hypothetical protein
MMSTTIDAVRAYGRAVARRVMSRWPAPGLIAVVAGGGALICWLYVAAVANNLETPKAAPAVGSGPVSSVLQNDRGDAGKPATDLSSAIAALKQSVDELAAGLDQVKQGLQAERDRNGKESHQLVADLAQLQQSAQREGEQARRRIEEVAADIGQMRQALQQEGDSAEKLVPKRDLAALEQEGERIGRLNSVTSDVAQLKQALAGLATDLDKVRQAFPQENEKSERKITELATELMAAKQSAQRAHEESGRRDQELMADLAHLKEALQLEIYRNEKVSGKSSEGVAQIKEALRHESEQRIQIAAEQKAGLAQLKLAVGDLTADLASKQQGRQVGGMSKPLAERPMLELLASREPGKLPAPRSEATAETDAKGIAPSWEEATSFPAPPAAPAQPAKTPPNDGDEELRRLMSRASLLLSQGDIGAARVVLERAAETGNARALFALAETFDPVVLSAWGTLGTRGDAVRARELYAKALAGGIEEAQSRLMRAENK